MFTGGELEYFLTCFCEELLVVLVNENWVCLHMQVNTLEDRSRSHTFSYSVYTPEHRQLHDCQTGGALSPCLFLSLQFFNNQDDFTEDFTLFDIKLVLCTVACLFSLYALLYDYFIAPMPDSWPVLLVCSVRSALFSVRACVTPSG